jgi:hypothetical protein
MRKLLENQQMHFDFMYVILLHSGHQIVSAAYVEWYRNILIIFLFFSYRPEDGHMSGWNMLVITMQ